MPGDRSLSARAEERLGAAALSSSAPRRTCIACRGKAVKGDLLRFVGIAAADGIGLRMELDAEQRLPGRGVYCHRTASCLGHAKLLPELASGLRRGSRGAARQITWSGQSVEELLQAAAKRTAACGAARRSKRRTEAAATIDFALKELQQKGGNRGKKVRFPL